MVFVDVDGGGVVVEFQVVVGYVGGGCCAVVWLGLIQFSLVQFSLDLFFPSIGLIFGWILIVVAMEVGFGCGGGS